MKASKAAKVLFNICSVVCFIFFALYIFTLVFIPIGIYCFLAGKRFNFKAEHLDDTITVNNIVLRNYVIFVSIFCFPLGLLSVIPYLLLTSNRISVSETKYTNTQSEEVESSTAEPQTAEQTEETEAEKLEKFQKLQNFKEKGLITDEELEQAREQLFGKKD